jgi:hypothetical protein
MRITLDRYLGSHAFETLSACRLKVAKLSSFNDPFECMFQIPPNITAAQARKYALQRRHSPYFWGLLVKHFPELKTAKSFERKFQQLLPQIAIYVRQNFPTICGNIIQAREDWDNIFRVLCFTDPAVQLFDEVLMWSHYGNHHKGYRLTFDFPSQKNSIFAIQQVAYKEERVPISLFERDDDEQVNNGLYECIFTKNKSWSYEHEHRMIVSPEGCKRSADGLEFLEFQPSWLVRVDFGVRCPPQEIDRVASVLKKRFLHAVIRKAKFHPTDYALIYEVI